MRRIAEAVRSIFEAQRDQAYGGKVRFRDWNRRMADALFPAFKRIVKDETLAMAQANFVAREVNRTTNEWLDQGREIDTVFSADRVAVIALTEANNLRQAKFIERNHGKRVRWVASRNPCPECKALDGKIVTAGKQQFITKDGRSLDGPTLHPHCKCTLEVVDED